MIRIERLDDGIELLILNRPDKRNAMLPLMLDALSTSAERSEARVLVIAGEGRTFCAGFDLDACDQDPAVLEALLIDLAHAIGTIRDLPQPVVMAVHGAAIAGGCALLAAADYVVSHPTAKLGYPVLRIGVSPAVSAPTLAARIGPARTRELLLRPDLIDGQRAHEIGLVDQLVESAADVRSAAIQAAHRLARPSPDAQDHTARWIDQLDPFAEFAYASLDVSRSLVNQPEQRSFLRAVLRSRKNQTNQHKDSPR